MRLRNFIIMKAVLQGGVATPASIGPVLLREMYEVGNRHGHYRAFLSLLRNSASWEAAAETYRNINVPVLLIWSEKDWSNPSERAHDGDLIPTATTATIANGGHFLPLDRPQELRRLIVQFARDQT
jgi:pimeloyl-ACP methyl ester carboxylesterase